MNTLGRYILSEFIKLLVIALFTFIMLFIMVDLFENMNGLLRNNVPFASSVRFFAYKVPFIVGQVFPVAVLISVLLSLGMLARHGEITAIKAGGIRLLRVFIPLFAAGFLITIGVVILNESVTPAASRKAEAFRKTWMSEPRKGAFGSEGMWIRTDQGIVNIRHIDTRKDILEGVTVYLIEKPFTIKERIHSRKVFWRAGKWVTQDAEVWRFSVAGQVIKAQTAGLVLEGLAEPADLTSIEDIQKNMGIGELKRYIDNLEREGYEAYRYKTDLYGRLTFPLVNFIMVFVGIPFALKSGRSGGVAAGVGLSVIIAFSYWVVFAASRSMGSVGIIPPLLAASFPDILFFAAGAFMLGYVRQ